MNVQLKHIQQQASELSSLQASRDFYNNDSTRIVSIDQANLTNRVREPSAEAQERLDKMFFPKYLGVHSRFVERIIHLIENNLGNESYGILQLCDDAGTSRTQLHNKLKKLTGFSTSIFIRLVRLRRAQLLLRTTDLSITQIAFEVGFDDALYFSRVFSQMFRQSPRAFRKHSLI